jgi:hypothetical protein
MRHGLHRHEFMATLLVILLCLFSWKQGSGQTDQGTITGVVQDSTGAVIPNAQITLTNVDTGFVQKTVSDGSGIYVFPPVKIGNYNVTAGAPGFETTTQEHVHLNVGERLNVPISLKAGATTESVTVTTAPPLLQTQSGTVEQVLSTESINSIALNGRNWVYIAQLTAGVDPAEGSRGAGEGDFEANGQDAGQNNFVLDGVDNNSSSSDYLNGTSFVVRPPPDALAEFKISTSDYTAEFGHSAGAVVNASLKSGTNQIHGALWEYFRNDVLDAKDFDAVTVPKYRQNQFGGILGFPIIRNKLFFFADGEENRRVFGEATNETVPTALMRQGNFSELLNTNLTGAAQPVQLYEPNSGGTQAVQYPGQNNVFNPNELSSVALAILNLYPKPNINGANTYNNYTTNRDSTDDRWSWDARADWNISARDQSFVRYSYLNEPSNHPAPLGPILDGGNFADDGSLKNFGEDFVGNETHVFSPSFTNEFRFSYQYSHYLDSAENSNKDIASTLGLGGIPYTPGNGGMPIVTISGVPGSVGSSGISGANAVGGISQFGSPAYYTADEYQNTYEILDNVTKIVGNHALKFGVEFESIRFSTLEPAYPLGNYQFNGQYTSNPGVSFTGFGVADFVTDQVHSTAIANISNEPDSRWYKALYAQDDWRIGTKLTLNLGVRYEYAGAYKETSGRQASFVATGPLGIGTGSGSLSYPTSQKSVTLAPKFLNALAQDNITLKYVDNPYLTSAQLTNVAPRIGFAYQVDPKTVVHGGFGIFFGALENVGGTPNIASQYPFQFNSNFPAPNCGVGPGNCPSNGFTLETGFTSQIAAGLLNAVSTPGLNGEPVISPTPYSQSENITIQRALNDNLTVNLGYVGSVGRHIFNGINPNAPEALQNPGNSSQSVQPFPQFSGFNYIASSGASTYNALQAQVQKRYGRGLSFFATYTWSHAMDDAPTTLGSTGEGGYRNTNLVPILQDYANSPWDTRQRLTFNGLYDLPFGMGRAYLNRPGVTNILAGGWSGNLTFVAQTGNPFTVFPDITTASGGGAKAILVGDPFKAGGSPDASNPGVTCAQKVRTKTNWYNPCAYANPLAGSLISPGPNGTDPTTPQPGYSYPEYVTGLKTVESFLGGRRENATGPGYERINMSIFKDFNTFREQKLEFRTDIFNVLNTPAYGDPSTTSNNSNGGQITSARAFQNYTPDARFFQFSLKYSF